MPCEIWTNLKVGQEASWAWKHLRSELLPDLSPLRLTELVDYSKTLSGDARGKRLVDVMKFFREKG